jgi:hypothetical protein
MHSPICLAFAKAFPARAPLDQDIFLHLEGDASIFEILACRDICGFNQSAESEQFADWT